MTNNPRTTQHRNGLFTDGSKPPPEYGIWVGMRQRCNNPANWAWEWYGGRGIKICDRWDDPALFLEDMGPRPTPNHSIERKDNSVGYNPENCIWASAKEQANNRRNSIILDGMTIQEISVATGLTYAGVYARYTRGWSIDMMATKPKITDGDRSTNRMLTANGKTQSIRKWERETGLGSGTIVKRLAKGWTAEKSVSTEKFTRYSNK